MGQRSSSLSARLIASGARPLTLTSVSLAALVEVEHDLLAVFVQERDQPDREQQDGDEIRPRRPVLAHEHHVRLGARSIV